jgi:hypothetical protein
MIPSASKACIAATAIRLAVRATAARSSSAISRMPRAGARGMTSVCPGERGMMSRKARLRSSLKTSRQGISPRRIFAKTF